MVFGAGPGKKLVTADGILSRYVVRLNTGFWRRCGIATSSGLVFHAAVGLVLVDVSCDVTDGRDVVDNSADDTAPGPAFWNGDNAPGPRAVSSGSRRAALRREPGDLPTGGGPVPRQEENMWREFEGV